MGDHEKVLAVQIKRWSGSAIGRNPAVAYRDLIWTVATATDLSADFEAQAEQSLQMLDAHLVMTGSDRAQLLSLQVMVTEISNCDEFDILWKDWIGPNHEHWPQRACFQAALAPGLLVELVAVAAPASVGQVTLPKRSQRDA